MTRQQPRDGKGRFAPFVGTSGDDVFDALWNRMRTAELHRLAPLIGKKVRIVNDER